MNIPQNKKICDLTHTGKQQEGHMKASMDVILGRNTCSGSLRLAKACTPVQIQLALGSQA